MNATPDYDGRAVRMMEELKSDWAQETGKPALYWHIVSLRNGQWSVTIREEDATRSQVVAGPGRGYTLYAAVSAVINEYYNQIGGAR